MKQERFSAQSTRGKHAQTSARNPSGFIEQHVSPLFFGNTVAASGSGFRELRSEEEFYRHGDATVLQTVRLTGFRLSDWFPRAPGVFWSRHALRVREATWESESSFDPELGKFYSPRSKGDLIQDGGIGTIRLRTRRIDGEDCWMATAVSGEICHSGIPLAIPQRVLHNSDISWGDQVTIEGTVRFLQETGLEDIAAHIHHASPLVIFVSHLAGVRAGRHFSPIVITPVSLFEAHSPRENRYDRIGYTFVHCPAGDITEYEAAAEWIEKYARIHNGRVVTNFDERYPVLADAPLSYQRLLSKTYDRTVIEHLHFQGNKLADSIDRVVQDESVSINVSVGRNSVVHGDVLTGKTVMSKHKPFWEEHLPGIIGIVFLVTTIALAIAFPEPTEFQYRVFAGALAICLSGIGAEIPGFLNVKLTLGKKLVVTAAGALAIFVLTYFFRPA